MDHLAILEARIARARRIDRPILRSACDLVAAAAAGGSALTLNPVQVLALHHHLDGLDALREVHHLQQSSGAPSNIVPFASRN